MAEGVLGLLRDKTRPSRIKPLGAEVAERILKLTLADPPGETTHWTAEAMAKSIGISASAVRRIWGLSGILCAGPVDHHARTNLSSNMMANWVFASPHSRGDIFHSVAV